MFQHIHQALAQVRELQQRVVENQMFRGWSGRGRMACGVLALLTLAGLQRPTVPASIEAHLWGWGLLCLLAGGISGGALLYWFWCDPQVNRDWRRLRPILQIFPPLTVGGVMTLAAILQGRHEWLFGIWMLHFGLANLAARRVLPRTIAVVGALYLLAGAVCLLYPPVFTNPWPMGLTFFFGEVAAGLILHLDLRRSLK